MSDPAEYVLLKRGLFWRPEAMGYTGIREEAGLYTREYAEARCNDGVTMMPISEAPEFAPACWEQTKTAYWQKRAAAAETALAAAQAEVVRMREALGGIASDRSGSFARLTATARAALQAPTTGGDDGE